MPQFYPNSATLIQAEEMRTALALSKVRLFNQAFVPTVSTTKTELEAAEADYTGYTAGGETITAWLPAVFAPSGGAMISSPTVQFDVSGPVVDTDIVGGFWLEDASGDVRAIGQFAAPIPMETLGQGFPLNLSLAFPTGQTV